MDVGSGFDERSITKTDLVQFAAGTQNTEDNCRNPDNRNDYNVTSTLFDRGFTGHEHLPQFGLINMNGRVYDPFLARFLSPDPYVQAPDYSQNFNRYSYCVNNPLKYTDPSGNFFLIDSYLIGFIHGFFSTGSDRWGAGMSEAIKRSGNDAKLWGGLFVTDPNKSTGGQLWEVFSRFTWQLPQTIGGWGTAQSYNTFGLKGGVESVEYKYGATVVSTRKDWTAVTQGSYIVGGNRLKADANNPLFQHEYGHYIQSQDMGWAYYSRVGLPSLGSEKGNYKQNYPSHNYHPVEQDANRRAFLYFNKHVDGFQDDEFKYDDKGWNFMANPLDINKTGQGEYIDYQNANSVSLLNNLKVKPKWYDYIFPIISGFYNSYQYNH